MKIEQIRQWDLVRFSTEDGVEAGQVVGIVREYPPEEGSAKIRLDYDDDFDEPMIVNAKRILGKITT